MLDRRDLLALFMIVMGLAGIGFCLDYILTSMVQTIEIRVAALEPTPSPTPIVVQYRGNEFVHSVPEWASGPINMECSRWSGCSCRAGEEGEQ